MYFDAQDPTLKDPKIGEKILNNLAKRVKIYNEESFDYKMVKIPIKEIL